MNFEFSEDMQMLSDQAQRLFAARDARGQARAVLDGAQTYDEPLWREMAALGWLGAGIPEDFGGAGLGPLAVCVLAEQIGQSLAATPYASSICQAAEAILRFGSAEQKLALLPGIAAGETIATFADQTAPGGRITIGGGVLSAQDLLVAQAGIADVLVLAARDAAQAMGLYMVDLRQAGVTRAACATVDPTRGFGALSFDRVEAAPLGSGRCDQAAFDALIARMIIPVAFEQVGGASACLTMARDYACERHAFGRPIGSFQAIKHKLARMFVHTELARSNANYGAWAMASDAPDLVEVAATARLSALRAYDYATRETLETFGGIGFTWEADCHLYLRRAKLLAAAHGGEMLWSERLAAQLDARYR